MKDTDRSDPDLRLLLEDYGERRGPLEPSPASFESPAPRFLLEDYSQREQAPAPARPASLPAADNGVPLRLLIADYDPFRSRLEGGPRRPAPLPEPLDGPGPDFLIRWDDYVTSSRRREARLASLAIHAAWIVLLIVQPHFDPLEMSRDAGSKDFTRITLSAPTPEQLRDLTRVEKPVKGKTEIFRGETTPPRPETTPLTQPVPAPRIEPTPQTLAQPIEVAEPDPEPAAAAPKPDPEPAGGRANPAAQAPAPDDFRRGREFARTRDPRELPAPSAPSKTKPKLELENPKATLPGREGRARLGSIGINTRPDQVIEAAIEQMKQGGGGGRQAVGNGVGAGRSAPLATAPGNIGSGLELLSDPKGVDFRPYLTQILNAVRRNWYAVIPESARLGLERGRVAIQFIIVRNGDVPKLVIADSSRSQPLDRAAVAGISASLPLPPLPRDYSGSEVRLQFVFLYNIRR